MNVTACGPFDLCLVLPKMKISVEQGYYYCDHSTFAKNDTCVFSLHPDWAVTHLKNHQQKLGGNCTLIQKSSNILQWYSVSLDKLSEITSKYVNNPYWHEQRFRLELCIFKGRQYSHYKIWWVSHMYEYRDWKKKIGNVFLFTRIEQCSNAIMAESLQQFE